MMFRFRVSKLNDFVTINSSFNYQSTISIIYSRVFVPPKMFGRVSTAGFRRSRQASVCIRAVSGLNTTGSTTKTTNDDRIAMQACVSMNKGNPHFELHEMTMEQPRTNEVLVKIAATGICHTDLAARDGHIPVPFPIILGHEGSGVIQAVGDEVEHLRPGDHVVMSFSSCGSCANCSDGHPSACTRHRDCNFSGGRLDGTTSHADHSGKDVYGSFFRQSSFATHSLATAENVVKVDECLPLEIVAPIGCGIQTGAGAVFNCLRPKRNDPFAVLGCGAVGMSAIMAAVVRNANPIVAVDLHPHRLELCKSLGATHTICTSSPEFKDNPEALHDALMEATGGHGLYRALDTTGRPEVLREAFRSLRTRGIAMLVGGSAPGSEITLPMLDILLGRTVMGVIQGDSRPQEFIPFLLELYKQGQFPFDRMVTLYRGGLKDINQAAQDSLDGTVVKPVVVL